METREWALITFTILGQMAVGSFIVLCVARWYVTRKLGDRQADQISDRVLFAIFIVMALGLVASLFHLGNPLNAAKAILNVGSSWLSREILSATSFFVIGGLFTLMQWRKIGSPALRNLVAWVAALAGLVLVFAMAHAYMVPTRPAWNVDTTPVSFYTTSLLLGVMAMGAAFTANYAYVKRKDPDCVTEQCELLRSLLRGIAVASLVLLALELVVVPFGLALQMSSGAVAAVALTVGQFGTVFALRLGLVVLGAGILGFFLYQAAQKVGQEQLMGNLAYAAFALVLVGEVLGRVLFYATTVKFGLQ